jgi:adenosylmethionine-8-amino-7-oxononanoate aminotransferase
MTRFWHPVSDMAQVDGHEVVFARGEGVWLYDEAGRRYLDACAGLWYCNVGYGRSELADAAAKQIKTLSACSNFGPLATRPALDLADRIAAIAPIKDAVSFFTSGGSESVDTAAKLVRRYWAVTGKPERQLFIVRGNAYHGMAGFSTTLSGIEANYSGYGELMPGIIRVDADDPAAIERAIEEHKGKVAAVFGEPVIGAGGVRAPQPGYWPAVQAICRKHDVLFVADEVITGFGRLGEWFGSKRYGIEPDLVTGAKGITSGYVPLGVVIVGTRVQEPFWRGKAGMFRHGYSYSGHATACAVALANLDVIEREGLVQRVAKLEPVLQREAAKLAALPQVAEVRSAGLLAAVELKPAGLADLAVAELRRQGTISRALVGKSIQISPAFVITEQEITDLMASVGRAIEAAGRGV